MRAAAKTLYAKVFMAHQGGRRMNPLKLTPVSDSGERAQPMQRQLAG